MPEPEVTLQNGELEKQKMIEEINAQLIARDNAFASYVLNLTRWYGCTCDQIEMIFKTIGRK
ncbi:hypothetical protein M0R72_08105 [Candidatus Pacearchaeota archaeon]|jgi:hypothetical protein|nr:hypothetical protein [Candidatus Pacearchaeota archaeon]